MKRLRVLLPATATLIALACPAAHAQWAWQWRDDKGVMVYSDAPPPPSIPASRVIRNPNSRTATPYEAMPAPASAPQATAPKTNTSTKSASSVAADPEEALRKRLADRAKKEQDEAKQADLAQRKQAECERIRNETTYLQDGRRAGTAQADGSIAYMDDNQRAAAIQRNQADLRANCG